MFVLKTCQNCVIGMSRIKEEITTIIVLPQLILKGEEEHWRKAIVQISRETNLSQLIPTSEVGETLV